MHLLHEKRPKSRSERPTDRAGSHPFSGRLRGDSRPPSTACPCAQLLILGNRLVCERPKTTSGGGWKKELTGKEEEPSELIYFKIYKSQIPVIEQAIETAGLVLGSDKSRGYCLEMICADFLAGANLDHGDPQLLLQSVWRFYKFLPRDQQQEFLAQADGNVS